MSGATTKVVVQATDASFDKTLALIPNNHAKVEVLALSAYAPAVLTPNATWSGFQYACPVTVLAVCQLNELFLGSVGKPYEILKVRIGAYGDFDLPLNGGGYGNITFAWNIFVPAGGTLDVEVISGHHRPARSYFIVRSSSGGKSIAPLRPIECTPVTTDYCKG
jgi:hypothetical protein